MYQGIRHILFVLVMLVSTAAFSQSKEWEKVKGYSSSLGLKDDYPYVNFFTTVDQKPLAIYLYYKKETHFVLALIEGGIDSVKERKYTTDVLFEKVDEQLKALIKLSTTGKNREDYLKAMNDPVVPFENVAIRYKRLHYNHYTPATKELLATIKNEDLVAAYGAINFIVDFFREQIPGRGNNK